MITITDILNPLTGGATTTEHPWVRGRSLAEYMGYSGECIVTCGNEEVALPIEDIYPANGEKYTVLVVPEGGDKQTWRIIGEAALFGTALLAGTPIAATKFAWLYKQRQLVAMGAWAGSNLLRMFLRDKEKPLSESPTYQWGHVSSPSAAKGTATPIVYGKARIRPVLKNRYVTVESDKQVLYALYSCAGHRVLERTLPTLDSPSLLNSGEFMDSDNPGATFVFREYVTDGVYELGHGMASFYNDIVLNGQAIGYYGNDVHWETRPGLPTQQVIEGFDTTYTNWSQDQILYTGVPVVNRNEVQFRVANGVLYWETCTVMYQGTGYTVNKGHLTLLPSTFYYVVFKPGETTFYLATSYDPNVYHALFTFNSGSPSTFNWVDPFEALAADIYNPAYVFGDAHNIELTFEFPYGLYGIQDMNTDIKATCQLIAQYREYGAEDWSNFDFGLNSTFTSAIPITADIDAGLVKKNKHTAFSISVRAVAEGNPLDTDKWYEVRVTAASPSIIKLVNIATMVYGVEDDNGDRPGFSYPGEALLGIKALATGQISGNLDVQVDVERRYVWVYDTTLGSWVQKPANNHAWAVYDILANGHPDHPAYPTYGNAYADTIYGCGLDKDRLDYTDFSTWADYIDEIGYELNICFDTFGEAWDAILRICQEGWGMIYPIGTTVHVFVDKPGDVTQLFTMGAISNASQSFLGRQSMATLLEVTYQDSERNYENTQLVARSSDWDSSSILGDNSSITLYGTKSFGQAWSLARRMVLGNELLKSTFQFDVDVDALSAQVGDVVEIQHDVLTTGQGGRIVSVGVVQTAQEQLTDGGLENWASVTNLANWIEGVAGTSTISRDADAYSGSFAALFSIDGSNSIAQIYQSVVLLASTDYTFSFYSKEYSGANCLIQIRTGEGTPRYLQADGSWSTAVAYLHQSSNIAWTQHITEFTTPAWAGNYRVLVARDDAASRAIWIDALSLTTLVDTTNLLVTFDRILTRTYGQTYELMVQHGDGTYDIIEDITGTVAEDTDELVIAMVDFTVTPAAYEQYSFGVSGAHTKTYRIISISRASELQRTISAMEYSAGVYDCVVPADGDAETSDGIVVAAKVALPSDTPGDIVAILNAATNVQLQEVTSRNRITGEYESCIVVKWVTVDGPRGTWEIWFRDVDAGETDWQGVWQDGEYDSGEIVESDGEVFLSTTDGNTEVPG
ncbi:MAG: phage tail protein [Dehalococcoidales bacterium]|nr:phage tail protein [Dehalococcoidales bacterium]